MKEKVDSNVPVQSEAGAPVPSTREETRTLTPPVDIFDIDEGLAVVVDLPGVDKKDVEVHVENDILTIKGHGRTHDKGEPLLREFDLRTYFRQFQLSDQVDQDRIAADMKYGVLTIRLPKTEKAKPKKISVSVSN